MVLVLLDRPLFDQIVQVFLEVLDPLARRKFCDVELTPFLFNQTLKNPRMVLRLGHFALEPLEVWDHGDHCHLIQGTLDIVLDDLDIIGRYGTAEPRADTL